MPAVDGWMTLEEPPALLGRKCPVCGTYMFPPTGNWCPNPACDCDDLETVPLSRTGTIWSYTDAQYQPPAPYVAPAGPYEPFAIAAVELAAERIVVLGQVASGYGIGDLRVGAPVEMVVEPLGDEADKGGADDSGPQRMVWRWRPADAGVGPGRAE